jgi:predicted deacetylase
MSSKIKYLVRLDDACPTMDSNKWKKMEAILDKYNIKPMVGIIPDNNDSALEIVEVDNLFWKKAFRWQKKKWAIALHGYNHVYLTNEGGINPVHKRSEFAGVSLEIQEQKIEKGIKILKENKIDAKYFFAPSHTFDENTIKALRNKSDIRGISDTISVMPYKNDDFIFYPQQFGYFREIKFPGYWTFCLHPNSMGNDDFNVVDLFIEKNIQKFISFDEIEVEKLNRRSLFDKVLSFLYFLNRKI